MDHFGEAVTGGDGPLGVGAVVARELGDRLELVDAAEVLGVRTAVLDGRLGQRAAPSGA